MHLFQRNPAPVSLVLSLVYLLWSACAFGEPPSTESRSATRDSFTESPVEKSPEEPESRLTKNWGGARTRLSESGVDIAAVYKLDYNRVLSGGVQSESEVLGNIDIRTSIDLEKLSGWRGAKFFLYLLGIHGGDPVNNVGDIQGTSNIQSPADTAKIYEAWIEQMAFEGTASFLFGLHDLNSEFYVTPASTIFLNGSFGVGAEFATTGANGPSIFPTTAPAFRIRVEPAANYYIQSALFGAVAGNPAEPHGTQISWKADNGFLFVNEFAYQRGYEENSSDGLPAKYGMGAWTYTAPVAPVFPSELEQDAVVEQFGSYGAYILAEQGLSPTLSAFFRFGLTNSRTNEIASDLSGGVNILMPFGREQDVFGLAFTRAGISAEYRNSVPEENLGTNETTLEATYRIQLIPGIAVQPDFQYIIHPGAAPSIDNALVGAARLEISL